jgi:oxalyl-CoA decarboxylase
VLAEADVVMLVGARLNWLLSHGKGKTWGGASSKQAGGQQFIQVDISPTEADSNLATAAPVIGDIGSCMTALNGALGSNWNKPPAEWTGAIAERKDKNLTKMAETLAKNPSPMNFHSALNVIRDKIKERPDAVLVNEGANALDFTRSIVDMYEPRKRLDVGTWGIMGIGMGFAVAAAVVTGKPVIAVEGDSAFGFSGMEVETICRYNLPVCIVIMNNNGIYKGTDQNTSGTADMAPTQFVKNARYDMMMQAFGGVGVVANTPEELKKALDEAVASGKPTLINATIDEGAGTESGRITSLNPAAAKKK